MSESIINARITATTLGIEDHGILTFFLQLEWHGGGQGFGGYALDMSKPGSDWRDNERIGWGPGLVAIRRILETVGATNWEDLKGKLVRAKIGQLGTSRPPIIGHILEDKWFDLKAFVEANK